MIKYYRLKHRDDCVQARLLDTMPIMDGMAKLREAYHRCMTIDLVGRGGTNSRYGRCGFKELNERQLFNQFAETVWKEPLTEKERSIYQLSVWDRILKED